jgi:hypothetical protein
MKIIVTLLNDKRTAVAEMSIDDVGYHHTYFEIGKVADLALEEFYRRDSEVNSSTDT